MNTVKMISGASINGKGNQGTVEALLSNGETVHLDWALCGGVVVDAEAMASHNISADANSMQLIAEGVKSIRNDHLLAMLASVKPVGRGGADDGINALEALHS